MIFTIELDDLALRKAIQAKFEEATSGRHSFDTGLQPMLVTAVRQAMGGTQFRELVTTVVAEELPKVTVEMLKAIIQAEVRKTVKKMISTGDLPGVG